MKSGEVEALIEEALKKHNLECELNHRGYVDGAEGTFSFELYVWPREEEE